MRRITFAYAGCPLCAAPVEHPALRSEALQAAALRAQVALIVRVERSKLSRAGGSSAALPGDDQFSCYLCSSCRKPFFGGMRNCERALAEEGGAEEGAAEVDGFVVTTVPLLCPACTCVKLQVRQCPEHPDAEMLFKCAFCCSGASFLCWGRTHFCEPCHDRQMGGERLNQLSSAAFPQCSGAADCPLGVDHPPNGDADAESFVLGCAVCVSERTL
jgi:E3 ubiquitin-protein ligase MYCBP2